MGTNSYTYNFADGAARKAMDGGAYGHASIHLGVGLLRAGVGMFCVNHILIIANNDLSVAFNHEQCTAPFSWFTLGE